MSHSREMPQSVAYKEFLTKPIRLAPEVELLRGADNRPMLYNATRGTYTRVTEAGVRLLALLDGNHTGQEILAELKHRGHIRTPEQCEMVLKFFAQLRNAGLLNIPPEPVSLFQRWVQLARNRPMLRLPLTHSLDCMLTPIAQLLRMFPQSLVGGVLGTAAVAALAAVASIDTVVPAEPPSWGWVISLTVAQLLCHELAHGVACRLFNVPIREAGVGLLYGFLPVAYIDYTDVYRLGNRIHRAAIALAGPLNDALWAGITAVILMSNDRTISVTYYLLIIQKLSLVNNLNPLLPSDGWQAFEALMGKVNVRNRALDHLLTLFSKGTTSGKTVLYAFYALAYITFLIFLLVSVVISIFRVVGSL